MSKPEDKPEIQLLIDGDVVLYQALLACEEETHWADDLWTMTTDLKQAKCQIAHTIGQYEIALGASVDATTIAFSCSTESGFRRKLNPNYKLNRKGNRKPMGFAKVREWMEENYNCDSRDTLEADDILGILSTTPSEQYEKVIVSIDKDFYSVPGSFYRLSVTGATPEIERISEEQANKFFALQTLAGDPVDGFSGVPKVGMKTAEKLLLGVDPVDYWSTIVKAYEKAGLTEDDALMNARMARILRYTDTCLSKGHWEPTEGLML
tara:strand:+ start:224 stop:1018 length:795 start_codon:yes stop_codon:yes gene_type:complete